MVRINSGGKILELVAKARYIRIQGESRRIFSFQNIKQELETQELESWKKLIRVLRHEIMNSITPITTLTIAIKRCFTRNGVRKAMNEINDSNVEDAISSAEVIEERSKGLISFVEKFRSLTDLPKPVVKRFLISEMFGKVLVLFQNDLKEKNIKLSYTIEPELRLNADEHLIEQVIINLIKNSIEAINDSGQIIFKAFSNGNHKICIQIIDDGKGIPAGDLENIFVPSFTTKENGMGVGLSISKQIIQLHHAEILVNSLPVSKTIFEIILNDD